MAITCAFAIVASGVALTTDGSQDQAAARPDSQLSPSELKVIKQILLNPLRTPESLIAEARGAGARPRARSSRTLKPSIYASAVDGEFAYLARTTRTIDIEDVDEQSLSFSSEIVRQNTITGETSRVFFSGNSIVTAVVADSGRVAASVIRTSNTRRSVVIESTVLGAGSADPSMTVIANRRLRVSDVFRLCGSLLIVNGVADDGDALASSVSGDCAGGDDLKSSLLKLRSTDSSQVLVPKQAPLDSILDRPKLVSGRLLGPNRFAQAYGTTEVSSGAFNNLWQGQSSTSDLAPDGSVALIGRPQAFDFLGFLFPVRRERKLPLMRFPQGDADRAEMLARSAGRVVALRFCGANLYAVKRLPVPRRSQGSEPAQELELITNSFFGDAQFRVLAYDSAGSPARDAGTTPRMNLSSVGCWTDGLVLTATRGNRATYLRYQ